MGGCLSACVGANSGSPDRMPKASPTWTSSHPSKPCCSPDGGAEAQQQQLQVVQPLGATAPTASDTVEELLSLLQEASKPPPQPGAASAVQPEKLLAQIDEVLRLLEQRSAGGGGGGSGGGGRAADAAAKASAAADAARPHVEAISSGAKAVIDAITPLKDGRAFGANWDALAQGAIPVLTAVAPLSYVGPAFALLGYALKQWSTFHEVPGEAVEMLRACRDLLADVCDSWPAVSWDQQRAARWVTAVAKAAAECVVVHEGGVATRFFGAHAHKQQLEQSMANLDRIRLGLNTSQLKALLLVRQELVRLEGKKGIDGLVTELAVSLLDPPGSSSNPDSGGVRGLLLHGMGGIGKSTIANQLCKLLEGTGRFGGGVYAVSVLREDQQRGDGSGGAVKPVPLGALLAAQRDLLELVSGKGADKYHSLDAGCSKLAAALRGKGSTGPVLILVDNVPEAGEGIRGMLPDDLGTCMPAGSRLIFTSRSAAPVGLALPHDAIARRPVALLADEPAAEIIRAAHAQVSEDEMRIILDYCKGLPLALAVVAGALKADPGSKDSVLESLGQRQGAVILDDNSLHESLVFSVDILPPAEREAWLDIVVLLYREAQRPELERFYGKKIIDSLQRRNLLQFEEEWEWPVAHDVLRCIAQGLCSKATGTGRDALRLVATGRVHTQVPCAGINGINRITSGNYIDDMLAHVEVDVPAGSLRILVAPTVDNLPAVLEAHKSLQWLRVEDRTISSMPEPLAQLTALQHLTLPGCSQLSSLPESFGQLAALQNLVLSGCMQLSSLPESFGQLAALQHLDLSRCSQLSPLPASFRQLAALQHLNLSGCSQLSSLPALFGQLAALQHLDLSDCSQLSSLPKSFGQLAALQHLDLSLCTQLSSRPESFGQLAALQHLVLSRCSQLSPLPASFGQLAALQHLNLSGCSQLSSLPVLFGQLAALHHLDLSECSQLSSLPESFGQLAALQHLDLTGCSQLSSLPKSFGQLAALQHLDLSGCSQLSSLPALFGQLAALQHLVLSGCSQLSSLPESFGQLAALQHLDLSRCSQLYSDDTSSLPESLGQLTALQHLVLSGCSQLSSLPESLGQLAVLQHLVLSDCSQLSSLPESLGKLAALQRLDLSDCSQLLSLPASFRQLAALQHLDLMGCEQLSSLPASFGQLAALQHLDLSDCSQLSSLPESLGQLTVLQHLYLSLCTQLSSLPESLGQLAALQHLDLSNCSQLSSLPESFGQLAALQVLNLSGCKQLMVMQVQINELAAQRGFTLVM